MSKAKQRQILELYTDFVRILETGTSSKADSLLAAILILSVNHILCTNKYFEIKINGVVDQYKELLYLIQLIQESEIHLIQENIEYDSCLSLLELLLCRIFLIDGIDLKANINIPIDNFLCFNGFEVLIRASVQILLSDALCLQFNYSGNVSNLDESIEVLYEVKDSLKNILPDADITKFSIYKLGCALFQRGRMSEALKQFQELQSIVEQQDNVNLLALTMYETARIYHRTGKLEQARLYFKDSLRLFRRLEDSKRVAAALTGLGNLELQIGHFSSAQQHLDEARQYYETESQVDRVEEIEMLLALLPVKNNAINQSTSCQGV